MNALEKLDNYLREEHGIFMFERPDDDEDAYIDLEAGRLLLEYGQEQRKEGYTKGFEDGEAEAELLHNRDNM